LIKNTAKLAVPPFSNATHHSFAMIPRSPLLLVIYTLALPSTKADTIAGPLVLSDQSVALIVEFETGGKPYYVKALQRPTWPGGASGVTIGCGYDLGYNTRERIAADWSMLGPVTVARLQAAAGLTGMPAKLVVRGLRDIVIPWETAMAVFRDNTVPRFAKLTGNAFPRLDRQHPHVQGVLTSIVFNRGAAMSGPSRTEMRNIAADVWQSRPAAIPPQIRSMKRLWIGKGLDGLLRRREAEACLVEQALSH
jgi:hypothetical protein